MVTSEIVEAMELFEALCRNERQRQAVCAVREMLCEWSEDEWTHMEESEKRSWLAPFLSLLSVSTGSHEER